MRTVALSAGIVAALAVFFLLPLVPVGIVHSNTTQCPNPTQLCSTGDGSIFFHGLGSLGSRLTGYGGAWNSELHRYEVGSSCSTHESQGLTSIACTQMVPDRSFPH